MKASLISQVEALEQEAVKIVENAKKTSEQDSLRISKAMQEARKAITAKADKTSAQIIGEYTAQANEESHRIAKEAADAASIIHKTAEKNRDKAIEKANQLFNAEYLS